MVVAVRAVGAACRLLFAGLLRALPHMRWTPGAALHSGATGRARCYAGRLPTRCWLYALRRAGFVPGDAARSNSRRGDVRR